MPAAWGIMAGKAPALKGRQAWTTPLRATNRLLTGPFKSDAEAQDFVNTLRKSGVQAFTFTSEAGQKVARVPVK
ncbi:SPOR domain-containing protein [Sphingomonas panni]